MISNKSGLDSILIMSDGRVLAAWHQFSGCNAVGNVGKLGGRQRALSALLVARAMIKTFAERRKSLS